MAVRKRVLKDREFRKFWEKLSYTMSLQQAVILYEIGFNDYMKKLGYKRIAVTDLRTPDYQLKANDNPYILYPLELIRDAGISILKRKSLDLGSKGFKDALEAVKVVENEDSYDVKLIFDNISKISKFVKSRGVISFKALDEFYQSHSRIYIYGAGVYGRNLEQYFLYKGWKFECFLVTEGEMLPKDCRTFGSLDIGIDDGIIIATLAEGIYLKILGILEKRCNRNQIFDGKS